MLRVWELNEAEEIKKDTAYFIKKLVYFKIRDLNKLDLFKKKMIGRKKTLVKKKQRKSQN